ncbi:MAG: hypothetical protein ACKOSR_05825 [Flavobacteriales bacterium]
MRISSYIYIVCAALVMSLAQACSEPRNFELDIHAMDSLHTVMDHTLLSLDSCSLNISDSVTRQLTYIQSNYGGEIKQTMARSLLRYGEFRDKASTLINWKDSLRLRKDRLENEIYAFRSALADRATHDATQREITELYADSIAKSLVSKQQQWHAKVNEWMQIQQETFYQWQLANDTILQWCDSIPQRKQLQ